MSDRDNNVWLFRGQIGGVWFDSGVTCGAFFIPPGIIMSLAEYLSKPRPVFSKLADLLGNLRAVQFVVAGFAALRGRSKASTVPLVREFSGEDSGFTGSAEDKDAAISMPSGNDAIAESATEAPAVARSIVHAYAAVLKPSGSDAVMEPGTIAEPGNRDPPSRKRAISPRGKIGFRRRWAETGSIWSCSRHAPVFRRVELRLA